MGTGQTCATLKEADLSHAGLAQNPALPGHYVRARGSTRAQQQACSIVRLDLASRPLDPPRRSIMILDHSPVRGAVRLEPPSARRQLFQMHMPFPLYAR